jgi:hypothetical protein
LYERLAMVRYTRTYIEYPVEVNISNVATLQNKNIRCALFYGILKVSPVHFICNYICQFIIFMIIFIKWNELNYYIGQSQGVAYKAS